MTRQVIETGNSFVLVPSGVSAPSRTSTPALVRRTRTSLSLRVSRGGGGAATLYRWRYSTNSQVTDSDPKVTSTGPTVTISGLTAGTNYWIDARAENSAGESAYSGNLATSTTAVAPPPTSPTITTDTDSAWCYESSDASDPPSGGLTTRVHTPSGCSRSSLSADETRWVYKYTRTRTYTDGSFTSATAWGNGTRVHSPTGSTTTPSTTVSANAGSNASVESGGSVSIGGSDTVRNGSGSTTISWTKRSGTGSSLSSTSAASPTFNAPTVSSQRTITWRKTVTNNGVSDTDDVTITVTAPPPPVQPTRVTANAGSDVNVDSRSTVRIGGTDTITNPVGATTYRWTISSSSLGSLSSTTVSRPTFEAYRSSSNRTVTCTKTTTNNGVSDSDRVTITIIGESGGGGGGGRAAGDGTYRLTVGAEISSALRADPNSPAYLSYIEIDGANEKLNIYVGSTSTDRSAGTDLSSQWETAGRLGIRHATPSQASSSITNWFDAPFDSDNAAPYTNLKAALIALATSDQSEPRTIILEDNAVTPAFSDDTGDAQNWIINTDITPIIIPRASGTPNPVYTSSGVPAGINIIPPTSIQIGAITGAPTSVGSGTITITATNSNGSDDWTIAYNTALEVEAPDFSSITGVAKTWISETAIVNVVVPRASGTPTPVYSVVGSLPAGLTFNPSNRTISGTPTSPGSGTITIRATNSEGSADWTFDYKVVGALSISAAAGNPTTSVNLLDPCVPGVNEQTIVLKGSWYSTVISIVKQYTPIAADGRPKIDSCLTPPNTNLYFQSFSIFRSGQITISFADHLTSGGLGGEGHDLSDIFESGGQFILRAGSDVVTLNLAGASDKLEPYTFETNTSRFFNAISANEELTLTVRDFTPIVPDLYASASAGVPLARAALVAAVLSASVITGVPTAQASLAPPTISIKASAGTPSASADIIKRSAFDLSWASERGRTVYVSAVVTAGAPRGNGTVYEDQPGRTPLGSVSADSDMESQTGQSVTAIALNELFAGNITFWDAPSPLAWSSFFTDNPDVSLWMQFAPRGPIYPFVARGHGGSYSAWATGDTTAQAAVTAARAEGARFAFVLRGAPAVTTLSASPTAGVPTGAANLQQPTLSTIISAGVPTARVNLQGKLLSATASAGVPTATIDIEEQGVGINTYVPPFGYRPIVLAFLEADVSGADITAEPAVTVGTGNDLIVASNLVISQVERHVAGSQIRLRRSGDGEFSTYFDNEGSPLYPDARLQILYDGSLIDGSIDNTGGGFNNWSVANSAQRSKLNAIATGERFVLAILKKVTIEASAGTIPPTARVALAPPLIAVDASAGEPTARVYFDSLPISASATAGTPTVRADLVAVIISISASVGVPTARAALIPPTISLTATTNTPTAKASLVPPTLSASASAATPTARAYLASLVLTTNDIDLTNLDVYALALINTGTPTPNGTVYEDQPNRTPVGSIDAGGDLIARPGQDITRIALNIQGSGNVRFWDNPSEQSWTNFFGTYPRATLRLQFEISGPAYELTRGGQGSNFSNWSTSNADARAAITSARANGKKFIFLLAEERIAVRAGEGERGSVVTAGAEGTGRKIDAATRSGSGEFGESATEGAEGTGSSHTVTGMGEGEVGRVTASATEGQGASVVIKKTGSGEFGKIITSGKEGIGKKIVLLPSTGSGEFGRISTAGIEGTGAKIDLLPVVGSGEFGRVIIAGTEGAGAKIIPLPSAGSGEFGSIVSSGKEGVGRRNAASTRSGTGEFGTVSSGGTEGTGRHGGDLTGFTKIAEVRGISFPRTGLEGDASYDITLRARDRTGNTGNLVSAGTVLTEDLLDVPGAEFVFQRNNTGIVPDPPISTEKQRKTDNYIPTGWSDNAQGVNVSNRYEYISSRTGSTGRWSEFGSPGLYDIFLVEGETEAQFIFRRTTSASAPNTPLSNAAQRASNSYIPSSWVRSAQGTTETLPYEWASYRLGGSGNWSVFYPPTLREAHPTARGPIPFFRAISGSSWSNSEATLATTGTNVTGDRVTLYNSTAKWTATRVWNGSRWITIGKWIDGNLIVEGSVLSIFDIIAGAAVQSSNYRAGVAGWRIAQDGGVEFDAASIRGVLSAEHIDSDVFGVGVLMQNASGFSVGSGAGTQNTIPLSADMDGYDALLITYTQGRPKNSALGTALIPRSRFSAGAPVGVGSNARLTYTRATNGNSITVSGASGYRHYVLAIYGLRDPNSTTTVTPPTPTTPTQAPNTPSTPSETASGQTSLTLSTTPGSGGAATLYRWRYSTNSTVSNSDPEVTSSGPSITIPSLVADTDYWVDVRAENSAGNSAYSGNLATSTQSAASGVTTDTDEIWCYESSNASSPPSGGLTTEVHTPAGCSRSQLTAHATSWVYKYTRTRTYTNGTFTSATAWGNGTLVSNPTTVTTAAPTLVVENSSLTVEEGSSVTIKVKLSSRPTGNVTVTATENDRDISSTPSTRRFTTSNWNSYQNFTITGIVDTDSVTDSATVTLTGSGGGVTDTATVSISITERSAGNTTVTANAGPDVDVGSRRSVQIGGTDTITNPSGTTTYSWARVSLGNFGSLSSSIISQPTFEAYRTSTERIIRYRKTTTNNNVSDTDDVTISITGEGGGGGGGGRSTQETTVAANAGSDVNVNSENNVQLGGADVITNPTGTTTYSWVRVSGIGGSLNNQDLQNPIFTAPLTTANRTIVYQKTTTNNEVSATDNVTITVTPPPTVTFDISYTDSKGSSKDNNQILASFSSGQDMPGEAFDSGNSGRLDFVTIHAMSGLSLGVTGLNHTFIPAIENTLRITITSGSNSVEIVGVESSLEPYDNQSNNAAFEAFYDSYVAKTSITVRLRSS